jgi:hypothetical protein
MPFVEEFVKKNQRRKISAKPGRPFCRKAPIYTITKALGGRWKGEGNESFSRAKGNEQTTPDSTFYEQWAPVHLRIRDTIRRRDRFTSLGKARATDYLGVSSSVDYVGHTFGPRSREITGLLVRLDRTYDLFTHLDQKVGGNYGRAERGSAWRQFRGHARHGGVDAGVLVTD